MERIVTLVEKDESLVYHRISQTLTQRTWQEARSACKNLLTVVNQKSVYMML